MDLHVSARDLAIYAALFVIEVVFWWKFQFSRSTAHLRVSRLKHWPVEGSEFLFACLIVLLGALAGAFLLGFAISQFPSPWKEDKVLTMICAGIGMHGGALVGIATARSMLRKPAPAAAEAPSSPTPEPLSTPQAIVAGIVVFVIAVPLVMAVGQGWEALLKLCGFPTPKQELIDIFGRLREPAKLIPMIVMATVLAPTTEELCFRKGLFRYLRTRIPPALAYLLPACLFALSHFTLSVFLPLVALALLFSLAYQRTGRILVPIIAHGLFNLNTIVLVLTGVAQ